MSCGTKLAGAVGSGCGPASELWPLKPPDTGLWGEGGGGGGAHLLHQHVDVQLGVVQHMAVRPAQAHQRPLHRPAVDVDPAGSTGGQELPGVGEGSPCGSGPFRLAAARPPPPRGTHWYTASTRAGTCACPPWRSSSQASQKLRFSPGGPGTGSGPPRLVETWGGGLEQGAGEGASHH